jgi:hypothetical protein
MKKGIAVKLSLTILSLVIFHSACNNTAVKGSNSNNPIADSQVRKIYDGAINDYDVETAAETKAENKVYGDVKKRRKHL